MLTEAQNIQLFQLKSEEDCLDMLKIMLRRTRAEFDSNDEADIVTAACQYIRKLEVAIASLGMQSFWKWKSFIFSYDEKKEITPLYPFKKQMNFI